MDNRPEEFQLRTEFGHWVADTVVSKQGVAACLATFIERKTRHYGVAIKIPNKTCRSMMMAIKRLVEMYPHFVESITCDRGSELSISLKLGSLKTLLTVKSIMLIRVHHMNSDQMKIIMDYLENIFQKLSYFKNISQNKINQAVQSMNLRSRKLFKWKSPQHKFNQEYSKAF